MKQRHKMYLKLNIMSIFLLFVSFVSVTLAWFAYSGIANFATEIDVKAWYIELEKDGEAVSNDIVLSLSQIYPGMDTVSEIVNIKNLGDSDAQVKYSIVSARILGEVEDEYIIDNEIITSEYVEDLLSHEYPFKININLSKNYVLSKGEESSFELSVSWPLDSDNDALDSLWGTKAFKFFQEEQNKRDQDPDYQIRTAIQIVISVIAEQYLEIDTSSDTMYNLGDEILFDVEGNTRCSQISSTCIKTYVMDINNSLGDETVTLLPDPNNIYSSGIYSDYDYLFNDITNIWTVSTRHLFVEDILNIIATDIINSVLIRENLSDAIIGSLKYDNRMDTEISKAISYNGYYRCINEKFNYLSSNNCYWTSSEYDDNNGFAFIKIDEVNSKIYAENKSSICNVIPVIIANKSDL